MMIHLAADQIDQMRPQRDGRNDEFPIEALTGVSGHIVEQLQAIITERRVGGHQTKVRVHSRSIRIVVSRPEMDIPAQHAVFLANDQCELGMCLQAEDSVNDMDAGLFQPPGPQDVVFLVEPGFESTRTATCFPRPAASMSA
jgi:hypothetical protein